MKNSQFNLLYEDVKRELIMEGLFDKVKSFFQTTWSVEDEFKTLLPFVLKKVDGEVKHLYSSDKPGKPIYTNANSPEITKHSEGSSDFGFDAIYYLDESYVEEDLLPCLMQSEKFIQLNKKYKFEERKKYLDAQLIIKLNPQSDDELDLSKPEIEIKKLSIKKWLGNLYLNLACPGVEREQSNISLGTIDLSVIVKEYESFAMRLTRWLLTASRNDRTPDKNLTDSLGESIRAMFGKQRKDKNPGYDKIEGKSLIGNIGKQPGATIKCSIKIDNAFKQSIELSDKQENTDTVDKDLELKNKLNLSYNEDVIDKNDILSRMTIDEFEKLITYAKPSDSGMQLSNDLTDVNTWEEASFSNGNPDITGKPVKKSTNLVGGMIDCTLPEDLHKYYYIYLNISDWKNNKFNNKFLWQNNSTDPLINIQIRDATSDDIVYSRWYDSANFKQAEPRIARLIQNKLNQMKPLP